jgi:hypothetical protein
MAMVMDTTLIVILVLLALIVLAGGAVLLMQRRRSEDLRRRFGPEYQRALERTGDPRQAEAELEARQKRVAELDIRPLRPEDRERYAEAWRATQARFVDTPAQAIAEADRLVTEVMLARGYPTGDTEQVMADLSVDHAHVLDNYRAARRIVRATQDGQTDTEDLRQAMVHYRALFDDLLAAPDERDRRDRKEMVR